MEAQSNADPMRPAICQVRAVRKETADTFTLELESHNGYRPGAFAPGQFNMLYAFGVGEVPISISGEPAHTGTWVHTIRAVGPVTKALGKLKRGDSLGVRGPFGSHWPVEDARGKDVVIVTGGIGLAPLRPALCYLLSHRKDYGRVVLLYGARTPGDILYKKELEHWRSCLGLDLYVTVDRATENWKGNVGVVTMFLSNVAFDPTKTMAMVCGPEVMMRFTVMGLLKRGLLPEQIRISMERNMKCAVGFCGHCQYGSAFVCKDGPVFRYDKVAAIFGKPEI